ncbi:hypothetical protein PAXRUDRAFT_835437 [Paxillus rubicundulus Ve08.2h10]|uniref:BTB domain-containing protein n=1 Tax=Paxillus rubicundulus Ve08.2h10 TaxID=930991 RepID=A0A0D0DEX0_9AGAM|nr:hypothetical protein PAXRUDRAFT_835437 [Paxillus rubicundulus Ve08.2h10]
MSLSAYVASPFNHAKADAILRSSDNIDFRVFKLFLSLASPFFETLFDIPQPTEESEEQETKDGLPVIPVSEDSKTLNALLRFCYPCTLAGDPGLEELKDVVNVLEAAKKYSLEAIERKVAQTISSPKILEAEPLRCYAIAHHGGLREEALLAAKYTLTQSLIPEWFKEIDLLTATDLLALLTYHKKCAIALEGLKNYRSWVTPHYGSMTAFPFMHACSRCPRSHFSSGDSVLQWWGDFWDKIFILLRDKPCRATIDMSAEEVIRSVRQRNCPNCSPRVAETMREFVTVFAGKVEKAISQVELELGF